MGNSRDENSLHGIMVVSFMKTIIQSNYPAGSPHSGNRPLSIYSVNSAFSEA